MAGTLLVEDLANDFTSWVDQLHNPPAPPPPPAPEPVAPPPEPVPPANPVQPVLDTLGQAKSSFLDWADQLHAADAAPAPTPAAPTPSDSLTNPSVAPSMAAAPAPTEPASDFLKWVDQGAKPVNDWLTQRGQDVGTAVQTVQTQAGNAGESTGETLARATANAPAAQTPGADPRWLTVAREQLNKPYIWGSGSGAGGRGTGDIDPSTGLPRGFDCSGYVAWVLKEGLGVDLPAQTSSAYGKTTAVGADQARPGDVVFYNMNNPDPHVQHMALYIGDGKIIQAGGTNRTVNIDSVNAVGTPEFRRAAGTDAGQTRAAVGNAVQSGGGGMPSVQLDTSSPEAFIRSVTPAAQWVAEKTGIPAAAMIGMAANETGYGQHAPGNNLFGIKGTGPAGSTSSPTWEVVDGVRQNITDNFRKYDSVAQSFQDFADLVTGAPRYAKAVGQNTVGGFVQALKDGGYMTDPDYVGKIQSIVNRYQPVIAQAGAGVADTLSRATQTGQDLVRQTQDTLAATQQTGAQLNPSSTDQRMASVPGSSRSLLEDNRSSGFRAPDEIMNPGGIVSTAQQWLQDRGRDISESPAGPVLGALRGPALISDEEYVARPDAARWRALIERTDGQPATDAEVANLMRGADTGMAAAGNEPGNRRMFHGTGSDFARPEPGRFAEEGLFGPGYYLTSEPRVAGGIVQATTEPLTPIQQSLVDRGLLSPENARSQAGAVLQPGYAQERGGGQGANVRAVDVPQDTRLLDVDQPLAATDRQAIVSALRNSPDPRDVPIAQQFEELTAGADATGKSAYDILRNVNPRFANDVLQRAGFDGVTYEGGQRVPMPDLEGQPIQHQATVIFPESLDKLRNAISGTQGGEAAAPFAAGLGVAAGAGALATNLGGGRDKLEQTMAGFTAPGEDGKSIGDAIGEFTAPRFPGVGEAVGGALDSLSGPGAASDEEILRRAKPNEIANARGTVQGFNDAYTDKRGLPREEVSDADVAAFLRGTQTSRVAALSGAAAAPMAGKAMAPLAASGADRLQGYMSSNMLLGPGSQVMNAVTQTEQTARAPLIRAIAGYGDESLEGLRMLGAASAEGLKGFGQMLVSGTSRSNPGARPIGLEALGLRFTAAQDEFFRAVGGAQEYGMELRRLVKENPGVPVQQLVRQFDKELQEASAKGGASAVFSEGGPSGGWGAKIAQMKSELINNDDPDIRKRVPKQLLGWLTYGAVPFSQMPETLLKTGIRRLPVFSEVIGVGETVAAKRAGDVRGARLQGAETGLDFAINSAIVYHVLQGNITSPTDPEHPSKVRIGDKWFDYSSLGPLGLRMGVTASVVEALKREDNELDPNKMGAVIDSLGKATTNEWFMQGAADAVSQFGQGGAERVLGKQVQALGDRLVPQGALLDYITKSTDPLERNPSKELPNAIWERPMSKIPGLSGLVRPQIDPTTGVPERRVEQGPGAQLIGMETEQSDPGQAALADLKRQGYSINEPDEVAKFTIAGAEIKMTPAERQLYEETRGKTLAQYAEGMQSKEYLQGDDRYKARFWAAALGKAAEVAKAKVLANMSEEDRTKRVQEGMRTVGKLTPLTPEPARK